MNNDLLLEAAENLINELEGKIQKEMKKPSSANLMNDMREWLKFLHDPRKQRLKINNQQ